MIYINRLFVRFVPIFIVLLLFVGCSNTKYVGTKINSKYEPKESKDLCPVNDSNDMLEQTRDASVLPGFLSTQDVKVKKVYQLVAQNVDLLKYIPCYCGCGERLGHKSNLDCFIHEVKENGNIVWNSHATTCLNCLDIAAESVSLKQQGKTPIVIRKYIEKG